MSASFQAFPQTEPPPPGMIYPTTTTTTTTSGEQAGSSSSQSSGSFGMVFVVLAIILVVSAVACALGRFCTKKSNKNKSHLPKAHKHSQNPSHGQSYKHDKNNNHHHKSNNHKHGGPPRPKDRDLEFGYRSREGDIMLGFDPKVRFPSAKVANNGDFRSGDLGMMGRGPNPMEHNAMPRDFP